MGKEGEGREQGVRGPNLACNDFVNTEHVYIIQLDAVSPVFVLFIAHSQLFCAQSVVQL